MKFSDHKIKMVLLTRDFVKPLYAIAAVLTYGSYKYAARNWQNVDPEQYESALDRHLSAWRDGEQVDPDTGLHHLAHAGCNVLMLLWFSIRDKSLAEVSTFINPTDQYAKERGKY
jgi:hypothetical protein